MLAGVQQDGATANGSFQECAVRKDQSPIGTAGTSQRFAVFRILRSRLRWSEMLRQCNHQMRRAAPRIDPGDLKIPCATFCAPGSRVADLSTRTDVLTSEPSTRQRRPWIVSGWRSSASMKCLARDLDALLNSQHIFRKAESCSHNFRPTCCSVWNAAE